MWSAGTSSECLFVGTPSSQGECLVPEGGDFRKQPADTFDSNASHARFVGNSSQSSTPAGKSFE